MKRGTSTSPGGTRHRYALAGLLAPASFWVAYLVFSAWRPEYSLYTKAISELGSVDAPRAGAWNLFGYVIPGALVAAFSLGLYRDVSGGKRGFAWPQVAIFLSGAGMVFSGVFPGDFDDQQAPTMLLHTAGSVGSYLFFLLGAFAYPKAMARSTYWKGAIQPTLLFTGLTILFGGWPLVFPTYPAVGQRVVFLGYFLWIGYMAYKLLVKPGEGPSEVSETGSAA